MIDSILSKATIKPGMIARLKVTPQDSAKIAPGFSPGEEKLMELTAINPAAAKKVQDGRKLDAYLRIFSYFKNIITGGDVPRYKPQFSKVEVELMEPQKPSVNTRV